MRSGSIPPHTVRYLLITLNGNSETIGPPDVDEVKGADDRQGDPGPRGDVAHEVIEIEIIAPIRRHVMENDKAVPTNCDECRCAGEYGRTAQEGSGASNPSGSQSPNP